ncbi:hypothetical protein IFM89_037967 [Coptis chinensis]|uniref:Uncharacterized protein n=1 Tax=Coptis chinensis TaxID=261450 RepID=A0A835I8R4_9MAGN|nr:hypothetical protein IFM89_037967 [Coptis chinensis]
MGWSETDIRCKKHPKQRQSPGVCSACLRERLAQLTSRNNKITTASSCSSSLSSSAYSSVSSSYISSPVHYRVGSTSMKGPISFLIKDDDGLVRSKSMAFIARTRVDDMVVERRNKKKKSSFWSRLIHGTSGKRKYVKEILKHSKTMKETQA